ncbi:SUKH-4 family immunity protein [Actinomadura gamaensis]|uniref:SUKH-4 family immunity protein n=1 Tax=Actinomadura gamaensis TaxID=1763541 RepID=A0ABV9U7L4_9ACTN
MIDRAKFAAVFGEENLVSLPPDRAQEIGLAEDDQWLLSHVGLPRETPLFTADVIGRPRLFDVEDFLANGVMNRVLFIGGPMEDFRARFFLDVSEGFIVRMALTATGSDTEVVNSSLGAFMEFLYRLMEAGSSLDEAGTLVAALKETDPHAFREPECWWPTILSQSAGVSSTLT